MQLELPTATQQKRIIEVATSACRVSRYNPRRTRTDTDIDRLAARMQRNGFEITRALWAYQEGETYAVFAGGTRLQAALRANLPTVPIVLHEGFTDDEIVRLADVDNENDEYHVTVSVVDVWEEYHWLWNEMGWSQQRIADAKGCDIGTVSLRIKLHHTVPAVARTATLDGLLDEGHLIAIIGVTLDVQSLHRWLTTEQAQIELTREVLGTHRGKSAGIKPTVKVVREAAAKWKKLIALAQECCEKLPNDHYQQRFVKHLAAERARTQAKINEVYRDCMQDYQCELEAAAAELRRQQSEAEAKALQVEQEAQRNAYIATITAKIAHGDARDLIDRSPLGINLLLIDPPYGMHYRSNRRVTSAKKHHVANDTPDAAIPLVQQVLTRAYDRMAEDSVVFVFTGWALEPAMRDAVTAAGFTVRRSLVWVKHNHGMGNLDGDFAPRHERILYAVKGNPKFVGETRPDDVLAGKDTQNSTHPTEKPVDLLRTLITTVTTPGDLVVDLFAGSGSTLLTAYDLGRDCWGCEMDDTWHATITDALYGKAAAYAETQWPITHEA